MTGSFYVDVLLLVFTIFTIVSMLLPFFKRGRDFLISYELSDFLVEDDWMKKFDTGLRETEVFETVGAYILYSLANIILIAIGAMMWPIGIFGMIMFFIIKIKYVNKNGRNI